MNEIEKMYENVGINTISQKTKDCNYCYYYEETYDAPCYICTADKCPFEKNIIPPFTAEKQIELIKYFSNNYNISINKDNNIFRLLFINKDGIHNFYTSGVNFAEQLALFIISRFQNQSLTPEEKQQIKEILE